MAALNASPRRARSSDGRVPHQRPPLDSGVRRMTVDTSEGAIRPVAPRLDVNLPVTMHVQGVELAGFCRRLSLEAMAVICRVLPHHGSPVAVIVTLPNERALVLPGVVDWLVGDTAGIGLDLAPSQREALRSYLYRVRDSRQAAGLDHRSQAT